MFKLVYKILKTKTLIQSNQSEFSKTLKTVVIEKIKQTAQRFQLS